LRLSAAKTSSATISSGRHVQSTKERRKVHQYSARRSDESFYYDNKFFITRIYVPFLLIAGGPWSSHLLFLSHVLRNQTFTASDFPCTFSHRLNLRCDHGVREFVELVRQSTKQSVQKPNPRMKLALPKQGWLAFKITSHQ